MKNTYNKEEFMNKNMLNQAGFTFQTVRRLASLLHSREISAVEAAETYLARIGEKDGEINAYITVTEALAMENAARADALLSRGEGGPLCGIPCSVKDNIAVKGYPTTCASRMLRNFVPPYSATVCEKLWEGGAVVLGKTNLDEFAMGSACEKSIFGAARNPLDLTRSAGGSSGGAAASVAAGEAAFALATDTGGSARQPASFTGLVSMKPTYGLVSRYGMVELASSLEQICPITRTTADNALVLSLICGKDKRDMTTLPELYDNDYLSASVDISKLKVGVFADFEGFCDPAVARCVLRGAEKLRRLGASVDSVVMPSPHLARDVYVITMAAEASSNLARYDGIRYGHSAEDVTAARSEGFGEEVRRRIITGSYALSSTYKGDYYRKVKEAQREICRMIDEIFLIYDIILMPTVGTAAFPLGSFDDSPTGLYNSDCFTVLANLTGCPAITLPCGGDEGLPVGLTLMGRKLSEMTLYGTAAVLEEEWKDELAAEVKSYV